MGRHMGRCIGLSLACAALLLATVAGTASARTCTFDFENDYEGDDPGGLVVHWLPEAYLPVGSGDVICGGGGRDGVGSIEVGGQWRGLDGGVFLGGDGDDVVSEMHGGRYFGGPGNDQFSGERIYGGVFRGGRGDDLVDGLVAGRFFGGRGDDKVDWLEGGTFHGGPGYDEVVTCVDPGAVQRGVEEVNETPCQ